MEADVTGPITLPFVDVPDETIWQASFGAWFCTGSDAVEAARRIPAGLDVAIDIETPSVTDSFSIKCVTAAWWEGGVARTVLLDPLRRPADAEALRTITSRARWLILHNCFAGHTRLITHDGVKRFDEIAGQTVEVWSDGAWRKAPARCYGVAPTQRVHVVPARYRSNIRHTFDATSNHRWPLTDGRLVNTADLRPGDVVEAARVIAEVDHTSDAFKHGLIYADGALYTNQPVAEGVWGFQLRLCGDKARWAHLFDKVTYPPSAGGDPVVTGRLPFNPKALPVNPDADYVTDFIEGWQLLDGNEFGANRQVTTHDVDAADWLARHAAAGGWYVTGRSVHTVKNGYKPGSVSHRVTLSRGGDSKPVAWRVTAVDAPGDPVPVYCVEVPGIERFTLAEGVYTGNSPFDIPGLVAAGLLELRDVAKVMDTLVLARSAWPEVTLRKRLEDLAGRVLGMRDLANALKLAQKASGLTSNEKWFAKADIHMPAYRHGAIADTVATLRLAHPLFDAATDRQLNHPFHKYGCTDRSDAAALVLRAQEANRVMLRRAAIGYDVDLDYLDRYVDKVEIQREAARRTLERAKLRPGVGMDLLRALHADGQMPDTWPRTPPSKTFPAGQWKSDKTTLEEWLPDHPLADAHRVITETKKILGYMEKVAARSRITGRLHPQFQILGASATGRMSVAEPELQQFSEEARPIILPRSQGLHSVDWSSIEPALLGWMSQDWQFIDPFEAGADIYEPVGRTTGKPRKTNKVVVLAGMYGQGGAKLARSLGITLEEARQLQRQMRAAMPKASRFMGLIKQVADEHALCITAAGRILPVESFNGAVAAYKAVNKVFQGSCADLIYDTIIAAERAGIGDAIILPMHDEIVCDSEAADDIQRIMSTPPEYLLKWTGGRVPVIRTDSQGPFPHWKKV
jgi:DNA polymerase I